MCRMSRALDGGRDVRASGPWKQGRQSVIGRMDMLLFTQDGRSAIRQRTFILGLAVNV